MTGNAATQPRTPSPGTPAIQPVKGFCNRAPVKTRLCRGREDENRDSNDYSEHQVSFPGCGKRQDNTRVAAGQLGNFSTVNNDQANAKAWMTFDRLAILGVKLTLMENNEHRPSV